VIGILGSFVASRSLTAYLYDTRTADPLTLSVVCLTLLMAGFLSCLVPALRATAADPIASLRAE
jgi:ABC-type antimicrobial peptide transport system permease subunit